MQCLLTETRCFTEFTEYGRIFSVPLDNPEEYTFLLIGSALLMLEAEGPEFFVKALCY